MNDLARCVSRQTEDAPRIQPAFPAFAWHAKTFSDSECATLIRIGESKPLLPATIGVAGHYAVNDAYRKVVTCKILPNDAPWAFARVNACAHAVNDAYFRFALTGLYEGLTFLRYDFDPARPGKYGWHQDIGGGISSLRKLSVTCQLSRPADYDGCHLTMFTDTEVDTEHTELGDAVMFPAYLPHCVTPITRGRRYALVAWFCGPQFT